MKLIIMLVIKDYQYCKHSKIKRAYKEYDKINRDENSEDNGYNKKNKNRKSIVRISEKRQKKINNYIKNIKDEESSCNSYDRENYNDFQSKKRKILKKLLRRKRTCKIIKLKQNI